MPASPLQVERAPALGDADVPVVVDWILAAGDPFLSWQHGSADAARRAIRADLARDNAELSARHIVLAREHGQVVGGYVALPGRQLAARRLADSARLVRAAGGADRERVKRCLTEARDLFLPVDADDLFLSKLGVVEDARGRGLGRRLLEDFVRSGFDAGHARLRLDVSSEHAAARRLYESVGFTVVAERRSEAVGVSYAAMTLSRTDA